MDAFKIITLITAVLILLKIAFGLSMPKLRKEFAGKIVKHPRILKAIYLAIAALLAWIILPAIPMVIITPILLLTSILVGLVFIEYPKSLSSLIKELPSTPLEVIQKHWLNIIIWLSLSVWMLASLPY